MKVPSILEPSCTCCATRCVVWKDWFVLVQVFAIRVRVSTFQLGSPIRPKHMCLGLCMAHDMQHPRAGLVHKHAHCNWVIRDPLGIDLRCAGLEPDLCFVGFGYPALGRAMRGACVLFRSFGSADYAICMVEFCAHLHNCDCLSQLSSYDYVRVGPLTAEAPSCTWNLWFMMFRLSVSPIVVRAILVETTC